MMRTEVESKTGRTFTRSLRASSSTEHNKSALSEHAAQENHVINWSQATVIDREPWAFYQMDQRSHTHPEGRTPGHDEGSYQLSHAYDRFLEISWHGICQVQAHKLARFWATYVIAFLRHWDNAYRVYMSRGLANELLVTWAVLVTPDLCSAQDPVLSHHNQFSVMHI